MNMTVEDIISGIIDTIEEINETDEESLKSYDYFININKKDATIELFEIIIKSLDLNLVSFDKSKLYLILTSDKNKSTYHIYYNRICYYDDEYENNDDYNEYRIQIKKII